MAGLGITWLRDSLALISSAAESEDLAASVPSTEGMCEGVWEDMLLVCVCLHAANVCACLLADVDMDAPALGCKQVLVQVSAVKLGILVLLQSTPVRTWQACGRASRQWRCLVRRVLRAGL